MPGQLSTYKLEGQQRQPFKDSKSVELEAIFGLNNIPDLTLEGATFTNNNVSNDRDFIYDKWQDTPLEGINVNVEISDDIDGTQFNYDFDFFTDWNGLELPADNELSVTLRKLDSVVSFDRRAQGVTFASLEAANALGLTDYSNIPYIVENRKTILERIQLLVQAFTQIKLAADEVFKIINIAADITSAGVVQAILNLTTTITSLILQISQLVNLLQEIALNFFPPVLYHSGIKPAVFLQKGVQHLGYDDVEFGSHIPAGANVSFGEIMQKLHWCPSKNDEQGIPVNTINPVSGALKPADYGYNLSQAFNYFVDYYNCKIGIQDNVVHLRPKSDPFWLQTGGAPVPDVLVESSVLNSNGRIRPNYDEFFSFTVEQYATDDSDYHTLRDLSDENDTGSSQRIISGYTVCANSITNQKRAINEQGIYIDIPHTLCVRKDVIDDLLDTFIQVGALSNQIQQQIKKQFLALASTLTEQFPQLDAFVSTIGGRSGAMRVENHFFSTCKDVYLEDTDTGIEIAPRIPANYADIIGANALIEHYQYYNSFVPGIRNPSNPDDTNAKLIYEEVKIHMNIEKFTQILNNPYFNVISGEEGKYHSVKWNVEGDFAIATWWIQNAWMQNVTQNLIET